ncbi:ABC transporter ATP-binding protein [Moheibacter sediminis]|uniref:ABC-2 type transport system ATP-binding protein n=1 Tax=Moheibacter sediminis TaxID=1434700 RepID=A0A1W2ADQ0_9FLAO|nr:ATP-binding cassette domain-containing protein [Moheibacter sediminis]SMC58797.1 ABC-2 type transport system ATP-binding protein [Moheibacter sediminis]
MSDLLVAKNLTKQYGSKIALNDFDLTIPKGSVYGLLGPNGAGKTTFLRIINQITAPDKGTVMIDGKPLDKSVIPMVGYMPEERGLYNNMKIGEQALYFAKLKGLSSAEAKKKTEYWFEKLGISEWWDKKLTELSKGMGQKVQFVITVLHDPELLIFDEPFSGFDPVNAQIIANEILELRDKGTTIIFSTHRMESVEEMCDHIALINLSNKVLDGPIHEVKNKFKSGKYFVEIENPEVNSWDRFVNNFDVETLGNNGYTTQFKISKPENTGSNQLLQEISQLGHIVQYREAIPSINEIFLQSVKNDSNF